MREKQQGQLVDRLLVLRLSALQFLARRLSALSRLVLRLLAWRLVAWWLPAQRWMAMWLRAGKLSYLFFVDSYYGIMYSHSFQFSQVMLFSLVEVTAGGAGQNDDCFLGQWI